MPDSADGSASRRRPQCKRLLSSTLQWSCGRLSSRKGWYHPWVVVTLRRLVWSATVRPVRLVRCAEKQQRRPCRCWPSGPLSGPSGRSKALARSGQYRRIASIPTNPDQCLALPECEVRTWTIRLRLPVSTISPMSPGYQQLARILAQHVVSQEWSAGSRIPQERESVRAVPSQSLHRPQCPGCAGGAGVDSAGPRQGDVRDRRVLGQAVVQHRLDDPVRVCRSHGHRHPPPVATTAGSWPGSAR